MQELIARAKELLAEGTVAQQKAWMNLSTMVSADRT